MWVYDLLVRIDYDQAKNARNVARRGLSFDLARDFDFGSALMVEDARKRYPERRFQALGYLGERLHMLVFSPIDGGIRVISLRRANPREVKRYDKHEAQS